MKRLFRCLLICFTALHAGAHAGELSDLLRSGSHVLLMRHALAPGVGDPAGYTLERCDTQRVLNDQGKQQAVRIGNWLRAQGVEAASLYSSPWCRCKDTATLLNLGPVAIEPSLASFFDDYKDAAKQNMQLQQFIANALRANKTKPLILVTHHVNIREYMGKDIGSGDMVLAKVDGQGRVLESRVIASP